MERWLVNCLIVQSDTLCSFLFLAAKNGAVEIAKLLLAVKANVNQQCAEGATPLLVAATIGHVEMVQLLLAQPHVAVDARDDSGRTPLHCARSNDHRHVAQLLVESKAAPESWSRFATTRLALVDVQNFYFFFFFLCSTIVRCCADVSRSRRRQQR